MDRLESDNNDDCEGCTNVKMNMGGVSSTFLGVFPFHRLSKVPSTIGMPRTIFKFLPVQILESKTSSMLKVMAGETRINVVLPACIHRSGLQILHCWSKI